MLEMVSMQWYVFETLGANTRESSDAAAKEDVVERLGAPTDTRDNVGAVVFSGLVRRSNFLLDKSAWAEQANEAEASTSECQIFLFGFRCRPRCRSVRGESRSAVRTSCRSPMLCKDRQTQR